MSENESYYEKRNGEWVKVVKDLQGNEHTVGISEAERLELESDSEHKKVRAISNTELKGIIKEAITETGIQERKDEASAKDAKLGGGVIRLDNQNINPDTKETNHLKSVHDELDKLHDLEDKGSLNAKRSLDALFEIMGRDIMKMTGEGIVMVQCPKCDKPITTSETTVCGFCGFDLAGESGWSRYGDITGGVRR